MGIVEQIEQEQKRIDFNYRVGDTLQVYVRIKEGDKERVQMFQGVLICVHRGGSRATFTVRKIASGIGVERIFPMHTPCIQKIERVATGRVRQARLFYLRGLRGKKARLRPRGVYQKAVMPTASNAKKSAVASS